MLCFIALVRFLAQISANIRKMASKTALIRENISKGQHKNVLCRCCPLNNFKMSLKARYLIYCTTVKPRFTVPRFTGIPDLPGSLPFPICSSFTVVRCKTKPRFTGIPDLPGSPIYRGKFFSPTTSYNC